MTNESGLKPLGRAVLVKHYQPEMKKSLIALPDSVKDRDLMVEQRAIVVEIGPACWPDEPPRCKVGDKVLISRMSGYLTKGTADNQTYAVVNDRDIFLQIVVEGSELLSNTPKAREAVNVD